MISSMRFTKLKQSALSITAPSITALTLISALSTGCSFMGGDDGYFRSRAMDYEKAVELAPLKLPEGTQSTQRKELYPIAQRQGEVKGAYAPKGADDLPRPQGLLNVNEQAGVEIREKDDQRWLVVRKSPADSFELAKRFVENNGFEIARADASSNTVETGWLKPRQEDQPGWFMRMVTLNFRDDYDRFRFRIENAADGTHIRIEQVRERASDASSLPNKVAWNGTHASTTRTEVVANDLSDFIAEEQATSLRTGVLAAAYANAPRTIMTWDGNGFPVLVITMDMNRAWLAVGQALERSSLKVRDLNRSLEVYYLKRDKRLRKEGEGESHQYQLKLLRADEGVHVAVQLDDNTLAPKEEGLQVLEAIRKNIE
ncbi:Predicted outer membrane uncharacterized lipoprotein [gamma proteobacterium HdN1]|nr:Predicted outer membrane uncharacterized lipoprotein [gamma proteobacterium HdN1]